MWHIDAVIIPLVFLLIPIFDLIKTNTANSPKDRLFKILSILTFVTILIDAFSTYTMINYQSVPSWLMHYSILFYFLSIPVVPMLWYLYAITFIYKKTHKKMLIGMVPYAIYFLIIIFNLFTGFIYQTSDTNVYSRGVWFNITHVIFCIYCAATVFLSLINLGKVNRVATTIFVIFPIIAAVSIILQKAFFGYIFTSTVFTLIVLITYAFLQNNKMSRDNLTNLHNRTIFSDKIHNLIKEGKNGFVIAVALDDFKFFNQTFGQRTGDMMLKYIGNYLVNVSPNSICYRYGGDVFTIILRRYSRMGLNKLVREIEYKLSKPIYIQNVGYKLSASIGVVDFSDFSDKNNISVITALDFSIYEAKKNGKGHVVYFNKQLGLQLNRNHEIGEAISKSILERSFEVYLQPIYHEVPKKFVVAEALLRLNDSKLGRISPVEIVDFAERSGQIVEITYLILEKVCYFLYQNRHILNDMIAISINFSVVQFMQKDVVEKVISIINSYGIPTKLIKIEITESVIAENFDEIKSVMTRLSDFDIEFALDDYGNGYSNMTYLMNLPFKIVKLDKSIIDNIVQDETFIRALIPMFNSLEKFVVAEGIEEKPQLDILRSVGCDAIQGYYFSKPMPMDDALTFFQKNENSAAFIQNVTDDM